MFKKKRYIIMMIIAFLLIGVTIFIEWKCGWNLW